MNKILSNKMIKAISAIEKMYPKQDVHLAINDLNMSIIWKDEQPTQVTKSKGLKIQRKLEQVKQILGDNFIEFYFGGDLQIIYAKF